MQWRRIATVALIALLALPAVAGFDDLPLSRYPMYATARASELTLVVPRGVTASGQPVDLPLDAVAGTRDPLIAESWLRDAVRFDRADQACDRIAGRVAGQIEDDPIAVIEVRTEVHDLRARASGGTSLLRATVEATCAV